MAENYTGPNAVGGATGGGTNPAQPANSGTVEIQSKVPEQYTYTAKNYDELYSQMKDYMDSHKPLSKEDLEKLRKKQKAEKIISSIADAAMAVTNLWGTSQYAPNMYNGKESMTTKAQERFDKEKAEREANDKEWFNMAMNYKKLQDADRDRGLDVWKTEQTLARQDRTFKADEDFRNKDYDERVRQWQENFDRQGEWHEEESQRWEKQFNESVRQFNVNSNLEKQRIGMEAKRLSLQMQQGQMTFNLGSGHGNVTLTLDQLNAQTVSRIYSTLPANVRSQVQGDPIVQNGLVVGYKPPTTEAMLIAIGANVENCPATQNAIRQVAGLEKGNKPKAY